MNVLAANTKDELKSAFVRYREFGLAEMMDKIPAKSHYWFQLFFLSKLPLAEMNIYTSSISCWHENEGESDAMWELYSTRNAGIAIKSNIARVIDAFRTSKRNIAIAKVNYDSARKMSALTSGIFDSILIKRHAFNHETEVRLIAMTMDGYETPDWTAENQTYRVDQNREVAPGFYVDCDIFSLIEEVVISPLIEAYAFQAIETVSKKFLPTTQIRKSMLLTKEDIPIQVSPQLRVMWSEYQMTHRLRDFNEISQPTKDSAPQSN